MARSKRAGARREVLRRLREVRARLDIVKLWWTTSGTVWPEQREREENEYPENLRTYWRSSFHEIGAMIVELQELRNYCAEQYNATPKSGAEMAAQQYAAAPAEAEHVDVCYANRGGTCNCAAGVAR